MAISAGQMNYTIYISNFTNYYTNNNATTIATTIFLFQWCKHMYLLYHNKNV